jgi:phosphoribosylaminoimidazole-succinocarboxamide synthase
VKLVHSGKVRELYDAGDGLLLMVTSDRISAYDVIFGEPIPDKGRVLTAMTAFWNEELADLAPSSIVTADPAEIVARVPAAAALPAPSDAALPTPAEGPPTSMGPEPWWAGRALLVRRAAMLLLECIVRGRLAGQAYDEYVASGTVHGEPMPAGLQLADRFAEPIFTPSTKAEAGHDLNIGFDAAVDLVGRDAATAARDLSLALFRRAAERAAAAGFVLADTKFELGYVDGVLSLCDEVVTPDSSRLWPADQIVPGQTPPAYDKQPLRDWASAGDWDKRPPPPPLPPDVVRATAERYRAAYERVAGRRLADWYGAAK